MWLAWRIGRPVLVDVVRIVDVSVFVLMLVPFCDVQADAERHENASRDQAKGDRLAQQQNEEDRPNEWCSGEVRSGARRAKMAKRQHKQHQTHAAGWPRHGVAQRA